MLECPAKLIPVDRIILQIIKIVVIDLIVATTGLDAILVLGPGIVRVIHAQDLVVVKLSALHSTDAVISEPGRISVSNLNDGVMDFVNRVARAATASDSYNRAVAVDRQIEHHVIKFDATSAVEAKCPFY